MLLDFKFLSHKLGKQTSVSVILPTYSIEDGMFGIENYHKPNVKFQAIYLLHGGFGDHQDYDKFTNIVRYEEENKVATWVSNELGISIVKSELLPHEKSDFIDKLEGKVAYVGDGIALAKSDVGIGFGDAPDLAMEQADIVLLNNDLVALTQAIQLSKYARKLMLQNMLIALSTVFILFDVSMKTEKALIKQKGVLDVKVLFNASKIKVMYDESVVKKKALIDIVEGLGYRVLD